MTQQHEAMTTTRFLLLSGESNVLYRIISTGLNRLNHGIIEMYVVQG
jgi:hypothetical protein